jgi:hypothetical protein
MHDTTLYIPIGTPHLFFLLVFPGNEWQEIRHSSNMRLHIGTHSFKSVAPEGFIEANNYRDVLAALHLMFNLQLESYHVGRLQSRITDTMMLAIKESSCPSSETVLCPMSPCIHVVATFFGDFLELNVTFRIFFLFLDFSRHDVSPNNGPRAASNMT